ncbi:MAG: hypothetical protein IJ094_12840 [Bacilli bacterium]|nr:hypothetical protein [Bacilli bacterium]
MSKKEEKRLPELTIRNAKLMFLNLTGNKSQFNPLGSRTFSVRLDIELGKQLEKEGWNVKPLYARDEMGGRTKDIEGYHLPCAIRYDKFPPKIYLITDSNKTLLGENEIAMIDTADIKNVDLIINPSRYDNKRLQGTGIKAYVKSMYITINEDDLMKEYGY